MDGIGPHPGEARKGRDTGPRAALDDDAAFVEAMREGRAITLEQVAGIVRRAQEPAR